jgi:hypothetical protein
VASGGDLHQLIGLYAVALVLTGFAWIRRSRPASSAGLSDSTGQKRHDRWFAIVRIVGFVTGLGVALSVDSDAHPGILWGAGVALLGAAGASAYLTRSATSELPKRSRALELALWGIAIACACIALVIHRPDIDDAFYVNVAVAAADEPGKPLLGGDTMLGVVGLPLHMPAHRVHSYELWNGALSYVTGIPAIYCFHLISAGLVALLLPLAHARLFRLLTPRRWLEATAVLTVVLLATGETHRSYGNFSFVRIWQGKAVFLYFFMPLVYAYAIGFARQPTGRRWLLLCAAQIGALGCSAAAVWVAPAGTWMALVCALNPSRRGLVTFTWGALSSLYVLMIGWLLKGELQPLLEAELAEVAFGGRFSTALGQVFGDSWLLIVGIAAMLVTWACCNQDLTRRFAIVFPLAILLVPLNPYWDQWISGNLTGPAYWRAFWCLPAPILITLVLVSPLQLSGDRWLKWAGRGVSLALVATYAISIPAHSTLGSHNPGMAGVGIWAGVPGVKAPPTSYRWAALLSDSVPPGSIVLAPPAISVWIPTFHDRAHPLQARRMYLDRQIAPLGAENVKQRKNMTLFVAGENPWPSPRRAFGHGLANFNVAGVCLRNSAVAPTARAVLAGVGFRLEHHDETYEIWVRSERPEPGHRPSGA